MFRERTIVRRTVCGVAIESCICQSLSSETYAVKHLVVQVPVYLTYKRLEILVKSLFEIITTFSNLPISGDIITQNLHAGSTIHIRLD